MEADLMKGFDLRKVIPRKRLALLGLGAVIWLAVSLLAGMGAVFGAVAGGLKAFGTVLVLSAAALAFRAAAWKVALASASLASQDASGKNASLLAALIGLVAVGGTPIRLAVLKKKTGIADGAGSVVMDEGIRTLAAMIFGVFGIFFGFLLTPGNGLVRGVMLIAAVGGLGYAVVASRRRRGFFSGLLLGLPKRFVSPAVRGRFDERDRFLRRFKDRNAGAFYASLMIHLVVFGLFALEILAIGTAIDAYFPEPLALGLAGLLLFLRPVFSSIPAAFGVLEAGIALILALTFGAPLASIGVAIVVVLRLRTLVKWLVGWAAAGNPVGLLFGR
jgi:hypothetical protein